MGIKTQKRTYRLTGITPLLAGQPASEDLHTQFIKSKCPPDTEDTNHIPTFEEEEAQRLTVFPVDPQDDSTPGLLAYQVKGFFKEALYNLQAQNHISNPKGKADSFVFVEPEFILLYRDGHVIEKADDRKERPLRTMYMGSELTSLTSSERILTPWTCEFTVQLVDSVKEKSRQKSAFLGWEAIEDALDYGSLKGLLQWRNAGWGRFKWERIDHNDDAESQDEKTA